MDAQGFLMLLGDSGICPDVLAENAATRIFNSGARSQGHLSFEVLPLSRMLAAPPITLLARSSQQRYVVRIRIQSIETVP